MDDKKSAARWVTPEEAVELHCDSAAASEEDIQKLLEPRCVPAIGPSIDSDGRGIPRGHVTLPPEFANREDAVAEALRRAQNMELCRRLRAGELVATAYRYIKGGTDTQREHIPPEWWPNQQLRAGQWFLLLKHQTIDLLGSRWLHVRIAPTDSVGASSPALVAPKAISQIEGADPALSASVLDESMLGDENHRSPRALSVTRLHFGPAFDAAMQRSGGGPTFRHCMTEEIEARNLWRPGDLDYRDNRFHTFNEWRKAEMRRRR